jgi:hypothetical protein
MLNTLIIYGYHEEEDFAKKVGRELEQMNLPKTRVMKFEGRRKPREIVLKKMFQTYEPIFLIDLHDNRGSFSYFLPYSIEFYYIGYDSFTREMLEYFLQDEKCGIKPINFISLPFHYVGVEFFLPTCSLGYSKKIIKKLVERINEIYKL